MTTMKNRKKNSGLKVVGSTSEIPYVCEKYDIEVILFAIAALPMNEKSEFWIYVHEQIWK